MARFRVVLSELRYGLVENCSEVNSHYGGRSDARNASGGTRGMAANCGMQCAEQDLEAGGKKAVCTFLHTYGDRSVCEEILRGC